MFARFSARGWSAERLGRGKMSEGWSVTKHSPRPRPVRRRTKVAQVVEGPLLLDTVSFFPCPAQSRSNPYKNPTHTNVDQMSSPLNILHHDEHHGHGGGKHHAKPDNKPQVTVHWAETDKFRVSRRCLLKRDRMTDC